jgi:UDP-glucose 4-epimerase
MRHPLAGKRCIVTGVRGFLGQYVAAEAGRIGIDVVGLGDLRLPSPAIASHVRDAAPELVIHLAGPASVAASVERPYEDFVGIVEGTASLVFALRQHAPRARVLLVSSAAVYGDPEALPVPEQAPVRPLSPYGYHKRMAELLVEEAVRVYGAWGVVMRVFSAYGPGLRRQVVYELCKRAHLGEDLVLGGTGDESRDFIHAADVARAAFVLLAGARGEAEKINVASGVETTIRQLGELVAHSAGCTPPRFLGHLRRGDPKCWRADVRAAEALGFRAEVPLGRGVEEVLAWVRSSAGQ